MQLTFDSEVDEFLAEFVAFLDQNAPADAEALERPRSSSHVPDWARRWQRLLFDNGWLVPGNSPEFGGRNATILQQYVHQPELARRRIVPSFNSQGVGIIAASLITFGTPEQQQTVGHPDPARRDDRGAGHERAGRRVRPRVAAHPGRARRRRLRRQRTEGVDVGCTRRRRDPDVRPHRSRRTQAPGHQRPVDPHRRTRLGAPTVRVGRRRERPGLQRGLLHRRPGSGRPPGRGSQPGVDGGQRVTGPRAKHAVAQLRRPAAGPDRRLAAIDGGRTGPLRDAGDGRRGAAAAGVGRAGPGGPGRRGRRRAVGAQALRRRDGAGRPPNRPSTPGAPTDSSTRARPRPTWR